VADVKRYGKRLQEVLRDISETDLHHEEGEALWRAGCAALDVVDRAIAVCQGREAETEAAGPP